MEVLAESGAELPPILVGRSSMRVIDGMHRLRAAVMRGDDSIEVRFFDGDQNEAFVLAVRSNVAHGLPLSLVDRTAAAARIIRTHPCWSDRMIGAATGLAPNTVGAVRRRSTEKDVQSNTRVGMDGRVRPVNCAEGRRLASLLMTENPNASLREIARAAGVAPSTVLNVRERLKRGEDPVPRQQRGAEGAARQARPAVRPEPDAPRTEFDRAAMLRSLRADPSLRLNQVGRLLLRHLDLDPIGSAETERIAETVPSHCVERIAKLARDNAQFWQEFAHELDRRTGTRTE